MFARGMRGSAVCFGVITLILTLGLVADARGSDESDSEYTQIEEIDELIEGDPDLDASFAAQAESLAAHPELAEEEESFATALQADPVLAARHGAYEDAVAEEPEAAAQTVTIDSLMAADPHLAGLMERVEKEAGSDSQLLDNHGEAMAYLEAHPQEAEALFAEEQGPVYAGGDAALIAYVAYLDAHPDYHRSWWRLYRHLRAHPPRARILYAHWRWLEPRKRLWHADWAYRLRVARAPQVHRLHWNKRLYVGRRPALARGFWHHRVLVATKPALKAHRHYLRHHPRAARKVAVRPAKVGKPKVHPRRR